MRGARFPLILFLSATALMIPSSQAFAVTVLVAACPVVWIIAVMLIRFFNKNRPQIEGERRRNPKLRRILNVLLLASLSVVIAYIAAAVWHILPGHRV